MILYFDESGLSTIKEGRRRCVWGMATAAVSTAWQSRRLYPGSISKKLTGKSSWSEPGRNPSVMFFVTAPHILVIHS